MDSTYKTTYKNIKVVSHME